MGDEMQLPAVLRDQRVPARVEAAQHFLHYALSVRVNSADYLPGDAPRTTVELSRKEQATYEAALSVLQSYFLGEMDFGDVPPSTRGGPDDDKPKPREPVTT
jgi:hypothetical protein